jgi:hypothetical protein
MQSEFALIWGRAMIYPSRSSRPQPRRPNRQLREAVAILVILLIAGTAVGGGYLLANHGGPLQRIFALGQPTPVPTLAPVDALTQIQEADPGAQVSVSSPLTDEVDLVTVNDSTTPALTPRQATQILSLFMRGYARQPFWRWTDEYPSTQTETVYEAHTSELWVIALDHHSCTAAWTIYLITPSQIIDRGVSGGDYATGTPSHPGTGPLPDNLAACG